MENGDAGVLLLIVILFIVPAILTCLWAAIKQWQEDARIDKGSTSYLSNYNQYEEDKERTITYSNRRKSRDHPPNASFFGRIDGKEISIEGPYEEEFLTRHEAFKWRVKKRREEAKEKAKE